MLSSDKEKEILDFCNTLEKSMLNLPTGTPYSPETVIPTDRLVDMLNLIKHLNKK